MRLPVIGLCL